MTIPAPIELRWNALRLAPGAGKTGSNRAGTSRTAFVLILRPVDEQHILLEAWLETSTGPRSVAGSGPANARIQRHDGFLHLDVHRNGRRLVALTLEEGTERLRYAASPLLGEAGFAAGSFDPPSARVTAPGRDVASA